MTLSELIESNKNLASILQERLDWCVDHERYELAASHRDFIKYLTTDDEEWKKEYWDKAMERLTPPDLLDAIRNPTPEKECAMKQKYLYNK